MTSKGKKHNKHTKLNRPQLGHFGRNEWAILGTPCSGIKELSNVLSNSFSESCNVLYVDADHQGDGEGEVSYNTNMAAVFTDKIESRRIDLLADPNSYQRRMYFNDQDLILVNGNHFEAQGQIVVIDPQKAASLKKRVHWLTNPGLVLLAPDVAAIPEDLLQAVPELGACPQLSLDDHEAIVSWVHEQVLSAVSPVRGLVLAGGKSVRMGTDKGLIDLFGVPQREHLAQLVDAFCTETFLSVRSGQEGTDSLTLPIITDTFIGLGPFGAILSAFRQEPESAWLAVACDLPLVDNRLLGQLFAERDPSKLATAFINPESEFPEPLITIWEPKAYLVLLNFLTQGYSCPRKVLINSDVKLVEAYDNKALTNVNSPEDLEQVRQHLQANKT